MNNPERVKELSEKWRKDNPEKAKAKVARRRARNASAAGYGYTTAEHIAARWEVWGGRCYMCGKRAEETDHVIPISKGGAHWPSNLRPACRFCNRSKKDKLYVSKTVPGTENVQVKAAK
jgi:5-methylcytosine-specific restriction endonuclease McrA